MALLDDVKIALRISHDRLDSEIESLISAAREDMLRAGMTEAAVSDETSALTTAAIKTFVLARMANDQREAEGYQKAYTFQLDNLRKSASYSQEE